MHCFRWAIFLAIAVLFPSPALAASALPHLTLSAPMAGVDAYPSTQYIEDESQSLTIRDISSAAFAGRWIPAARGHDHSMKKTTFWVRLSAANAMDKPLDWLLEINNPHYDYVELYEPLAGGAFRLHKGGENWPFNDRDTLYLKDTFRLASPPNSSIIYYVRLSTSQGDSIDWELTTAWTEKELARKNLVALLWLGVFYGTLVALAGYNLFLFLSLRDWGSFWYVVYVSNSIITWVTDDGLGRAYVWDSPALWNGETLFIWGTLGIMLAAQFTRVFFGTAGNMDRLMKFFILLASPCLLYPLFPSPFLSKWFGLNAILMGAYVFVGLHYWRKGYAPAKYYVAAWGIWLFGASVFGLALTGFLPAGWILASRTIIQGGQAADALLFSLALAARIKLMQTEKEEAQKAVMAKDAELLEVVGKHAAELETKVEERTAQLKAANEIKDKFVSLVSHDLRSPLHSLSLALKGFRESYVRSGDDANERLAAAGVESCETMLGMIGNILSLGRLRSGAMMMEVSPDSLHRLFARAWEPLVPLASAKRLSFVNDLPPDRMETVDPVLLKEVAANLLSNALKYSNAGGTIRAFFDPERRAYAVRDDGVGIPPEMLPILFAAGRRNQRRGTAGEAGSGYGLTVCQDIVEAHGGSLAVESGPGKGTTFFIRLPSPR